MTVSVWVLVVCALSIGVVLYAAYQLGKVHGAEETRQQRARDRVLRRPS